MSPTAKRIIQNNEGCYKTAVDFGVLTFDDELNVKSSNLIKVTKLVAIQQLFELKNQTICLEYMPDKYREIAVPAKEIKNQLEILIDFIADGRLNCMTKVKYGNGLTKYYLNFKFNFGDYDWKIIFMKEAN